MKKFLPFLLVLIGFTSTAQNVNIPDPVFKNYLLSLNPSVDVNSDNEIQVSEATSYLMPLSLNTLNIHDLTGIRAFTNLDNLWIQGLPLTSLDISGLNKLKWLSISQMESITSINMSGINNLDQLNIFALPLTTVINTTGVNSKRFDINHVAVTSLDMSSFTALDNFTINQTPVTSLDLTNCTALITALIETNFQLTSLNVSGITTLKMLSCDINNLSTLNITGCIGISNLNCSDNHITSLNLAGLTSLTSLNCSVNNLTALDLSGLNNLGNLFCSNNLITSLNVHDLPNLGYLHCSDNKLTSLSFSNCPLLHEVICGNENYFTSVDLSNGLPGLVTFNCINTPSLTGINLANCPSLKNVVCHGTSMASLDLSVAPSITGISCFNAALTSLNAAGCTALQYVQVSNNHLTTLDCSSTALISLDVTNNELTYLNIKNGFIITDIVNGFKATGNPNLQYVCTDDDEVSAIHDYFQQNSMPGVNVNSYCSFTPGGSFNTINGVVTMDIDNNGCTGSDPVIPGMIMKINDGTNIGYTSNNTSGAYTFYPGAGNFTINPQTQNPYFTITPVVVNFATGGGNTQTVNFCLAPNGTHNDIDITLIPISSARPGFDATYQLVYKNKGTSALSGNVDLNFDATKMNFLSSTPATSTSSTGVLGWAYSNLMPFETRTIDIKFNLSAPPVNNIDDTLTFSNNITPLAADETPLDNSFSLQQVVTGSFDPNDKTCLEGSKVDITRVGDYVHYMVRFQNTGNAAAENVVVKDMLETNFDWNSFELVKTSHPCILEQTDGNKLEFIFQGINLPAVTVDEPGSHGFIAFKVRTINTLVIGDSLKNNAAIYFDFNLPVITNTAASRIDSIHIVPIAMEYFKGSRQGENHLLNWKANCTSSQAIFDVERSTDARNYSGISSITASNTRCLQPFDFTDNNPAAGMNYYRIKMTDINGKVLYSSVVALLNKKTGFEIVNLLPNPVINGTASLNITSAEKQPVKIVVLDASGKIVQSMNQSVISGFTQISMNFANLASGTYTIVVYTSDGEKKVKQFIKQ